MIVIVFFIAFVFLVPLKNLNGYNEDKSRKYKTFMTLFHERRGKHYTNICVQIYFLFLFCCSIYFECNYKFLLVLLFILVIKIFMDFYFYNNKYFISYLLCRIVVMLFPFAFVFELSSEPLLVFSSLMIPLIYFLCILIKIQRVDYGKV